MPPFFKRRHFFALFWRDSLNPARRLIRSWHKACLSARQKACHSELAEESALGHAAPASAYEFPTRWNEPSVPRELQPQVQILRLRFAPLRMTLFLRFACLSLPQAFSS
jgi:hypothetical protein